MLEEDGLGKAMERIDFYQLPLAPPPEELPPPELSLEELPELKLLLLSVECVFMGKMTIFVS
jgi:hypothetical protein